MTVIAEKHQEELSKDSQVSDWNSDDFETIGADAFFDDWSKAEDEIWSSFYQQQNQ